MKLTALAIVILALGIVLGLALKGGVFQTAAAKPPPPLQPVEEQNLDASGFIAVHEQGVAAVSGTVDVGNLPAVQDVNVISMPSEEPGSVEFTHVQARLCTNSPTGFCVPGASDSVDVDGILTSLSSQGWRLVEINSGAPSSSEFLILYTLSRPVP